MTPTASEHVWPSVFSFGQRRVGDGGAVLLIAEIGVNHEGSAEACARMIREAARAGADAIKLQTVDPEESYAPGTASRALFARATLTPEETAALFALARELGVEPFTTVGDLASLAWVEPLGPTGYKISSGLLTNHPLIARTASTGRPLLLSTGMAEVADIDAALSTAQTAGAIALGLFQCTSLYPAPPATLNLRAIRWLASHYGIPTGYSDHALGIEAAVLAVAAGACMIEKHFTLDPNRPDFDHHLSIAPRHFAELSKRIREAETMLGRHIKAPVDAEMETRRFAHRILFTRRSVAAGEAFSPENLTIKRPLPDTDGLPPARYDTLIGRRARRALNADHPLTAADIADDPS